MTVVRLDSLAWLCLSALLAWSASGWFASECAAAQTSAAPPTSLTLSACRLQNAASAAINARCGWYDVAENPRAPAGKHLRVRVAVVPALRRQPLPDPLFIISGGPGQAAADFYLSSAAAFELVRRDRNLVIVDQRGTGASNRLDCKLPDELESARFDIESIKTSTRACLATLPGDPRFYTTSVAVRDLDAIRAALGVDRIDLYGISYGTRVAQEYLRRYPAHVRALVLDGIVPVDVALGPEVAPAAQHALDAILQRCERQTACAAAFPHIARDFANLNAKLTHGSVHVTIPDPQTAKQEALEFGRLHLAAAVRLLSYSDVTAALLPFLIHEAAEDRPEVLAAQALLVSKSIGEQLANGMHNAVVCTEDVPFIGRDAETNANADSYLGPYFLQSLRAMCSVWPRGVIDADFHRPFYSDTPALLLSGANDPVTPVEYGERAAHDYRNGLHVVVPGQGHGQINNACIARLMAHFIESGTVAGLGTECVARQIAAPFMLNAATPGP